MNRAIPFLIGAAVLVAGALLPASAAASLSWEDALARAEARGDRLLVVVGAPWCGACAEFERGALRDLRVESALRDGWILVKVDADRRPDLRRMLHGALNADLPSLHFLDSDARRLMRSAPLDPPALLDALERLGTGAAPGARLVPEPAPETGRTPAALYGRALRDFRGALETTAGLDPETPLTGNDLALLVDLARADPGTFAAPLASFVAGVLASGRFDPEGGGFRPGPDCGKPLEVQAVMIDALLADAEATPERADEDLAAITATVDFLLRRLRDPATGLFYASEPAAGPAGAAARAARGPVDETFLLAANARAGAALLDAGQTFKKRDWVKAGERVRAAIPRVLVDDRRNLLHWIGAEGSGPSQPEDWVEWGRLLMRAEEGGHRARAREAVVTLRDRFVDSGTGLLPRPAEGHIRGVPVAPLGDDAARVIRFLADWAEQQADGEITFLAMGLLDRLASDPGARPSSVALSAHPMARQ